MDDQNYLRTRYKHLISPGEKSFNELKDLLKRKADVVEISVEELSESIQQHIIFNAVHSIRNEQLKLTAAELNLVAYKLINNDQSAGYYQYRYAHLSNLQEDDIIYVVFETRTGYINSNSNKLLVELMVGQGISQYDYDNDTLMFRAYLNHFDSYVTGEY